MASIPWNVFELEQGQGQGNEGCVCEGELREPWLACRVGMEQELLCECCEARAAEQNCFRGKNEQVGHDPSKIQALGRSI